MKPPRHVSPKEPRDQVQHILESQIRAYTIRTAGHGQLVTDATASSELRLGRSSTSWKAYEVYFPMDLISRPYLFGVGRNHRFTTETFFCPELARWAVYQVGPNRGRVLGFGDDPHHVLVVLHPLLYPP